MTDMSSRPSSISRRLIGKALFSGIAGLGAVSLAGGAQAAAGKQQHLRMVTSWIKGSPGPGTTADRIAKRITTLSGGRLQVSLYGAGELASPLGVLDAVGSGAVELGHTASFFASGKFPAATLFTTLPFGLDPVGHQAWIAQGGGQALWDELYAQAGAKPFLAGNSDFTMGGWFREPVTSLADLSGKRLRVAGLGAQIYQHLGAQTVLLPPGEIFAALSSGAIDGVEFLGPLSDRALGFAQVAPHYYWPGFNKPNGSAEGLVNKRWYDAQPAEDQAIIAAGFELENYYGLAEASWFNAQTLAQLRGEGVQVSPFPADVMRAARTAWQDVLAQWRQDHPALGPVLQSYEAALVKHQDWAQLSLQAYAAQ